MIIKSKKSVGTLFTKDEFKEKVKQLGKEQVQALVDYAIEKGTPVLESAAADVRAKAIDVTKEVLEKLENK